MLCEDKVRSIGEFDRCAAEYAAKVKALSKGRAMGSREQYVKLKEVAEFARLQCEQARLLLERHTAAHGC
jgi:hypothetical protein